jgi:predicted  nucleic acid-binding Zn-ribbon protein
MAIKTINEAISTWDKQRIRFENAIIVLQEKIKSNEELIEKKREKVEDEIKGIEDSNITLADYITKADNFKSNIDKMFKKD